MKLLDSRRLTGPNHLASQAGAVIDVSFGDTEPDLLIGAWKTHARRLLQELDWEDAALHVRRSHNGASLAITAPMDGLYTATELNEAAWDAARDWIEGSQRHLLLRAARELTQKLDHEPTAEEIDHGAVDQHHGHTTGALGDVDDLEARDVDAELCGQREDFSCGAGTVRDRDADLGQFVVDGRTECTRCHETAETFADLVFDHQVDSRFALDEWHAELDCDACHLPAPLSDFHRPDDDKTKTDRWYLTSTARGTA